MLHQTFLFSGQLWQLFEVSQILEFLRYYILLFVFSIKKCLVKEACKLREVSQHDNIVKLLGVIMEQDNYGLVLELMVFENCLTFINNYAGKFL